MSDSETPHNEGKLSECRPFLPGPPKGLQGA